MFDSALNTSLVDLKPIPQRYLEGNLFRPSSPVKNPKPLAQFPWNFE